MHAALAVFQIWLVQLYLQEEQSFNNIMQNRTIVLNIFPSFSLDEFQKMLEGAEIIIILIFAMRSLNKKGIFFLSE